MKLWQKAVTFVRRSPSLTEPGGWRSSDGEAASGESVTENSVLALSAAWACVNILSGTQASLPLMVYRTAGNGARTVAIDHPLYRILHHSPNAEQTAYDFWEFGTASLELRGNFFALKDTVGDRLVGLTPIAAPVDVTRDRGALRYRWSEDGRAYDEGPARVLHIRGFGGSPLGGMSTLAFGRNTFGLASAIDRTAGATFKNGLRPSGVLTFPTFLKPDQRKIAEEDMAAKFVGAMNAGRPMVLEGGTTWQALTLNPEDAQMLQSRGFSVEEVCRFFGVPPFMVGHTVKSTSFGTGLEQQILGFQKFSLRKRLRRIEMALMKQLLSPADWAAGIIIEFNLEGLLRGDSAARAAFYTALLSAGVMTINEVRALENLPPVEGGDVPRMQMQNVPITQAAPIGHNGGPPLADDEAEAA
ncbi:phage portal protein [Xanthobacter sp. DSM 24535]|uniref:phage portal protein n=1 Tax=Roseixanthobacter psychrophilus TaxID=3119917 RepID=UPI003728E2FB